MPIARKTPRNGRINKLLPPRPFLLVPTSVPATGLCSNYKKVKNLIRITRETSVACSLCRCKDIIKDGRILTSFLLLSQLNSPRISSNSLALFLQSSLSHKMKSAISDHVTTKVQDEALSENDVDMIRNRWKIYSSYCPQDWRRHLWREIWESGLEGNLGRSTF